MKMLVLMVDALSSRCQRTSLLSVSPQTRSIATPLRVSRAGARVPRDEYVG